MPSESAPRNPFLDAPEGQAANVPPRPAVSASPPTFESLGNAPSPVQPVATQVATGAPVRPALAPLSVSKRPWRPLIVRTVFVLASLGIVGVGGWWGWQWLGRRADAPPAPTTVKSDLKPLAPGPAVAPETAPVESEAPYQSENFRSGEIVIGGEAQFLLVESDVTALEISDIRGEAFTEKGKQEVKLVVTWRTNKLSQATLSYAKGVGQAEKTVAEADYAYDHSLIIGGLDPASTYLYTLAAEDRFGNRATSEPHAVFTGARSISLFDLIAGAIGEVFGWAVNK